MYLSLFIHAERRGNKSIDKLYQLGLGISYGIALQIIAIALHYNSYSIALQIILIDINIDIKNLICPRKLWKEICNVRVLDNVGHNHCSTSTDESFHSTRIRIIQTPDFQTEEKNWILPYERVSIDKSIEPTDNFIIVRGVSLNQIQHIKFL